MTSTLVGVVGGSAPYQEALTAKLNAVGYHVADGDDRDALIITDDHWAQAEDSALWTPTVIVVSQLDFNLFAKALAVGAGAVHVDTPTGIMVDVLRAAMAGEALLPLAITQALGISFTSQAQPELNSRPRLRGIEVEIAEGLLAERTIVQIARDLSYSDRTIRRKLQGIYLKLGVADRTAAIQYLQQFGL